MQSMEDTLCFGSSQRHLEQMRDRLLVAAFSGETFSNKGQNVAERRCWIFRQAAFFYGLLIARVAMVGEGLEMRMIRGVVESVDPSALGALFPVIRIFSRRAEPDVQIGAVENGDAQFARPTRFFMEEFGFGDDIAEFGLGDLPKIIVQVDHWIRRDVLSPASVS